MTLASQHFKRCWTTFSAIEKERLLRNGDLENRRNASVEAAAVAQFVRNPRQQPDNNNRRDNGPHEQGQMIQQQEAV